MADGDTAAPAMRDRLPAHLVQMHPGRVEIEIEMEVDIEIELACDRENAGNLIVGLGVGIGTAADQIGAVPARFDQQLVGAGIVESSPSCGKTQISRSIAQA